MSDFQAETNLNNQYTLVGKVLRIRWGKSYSDAHNHVAIGKAVHENANYLTMHCKTYHFGKKIGDIGGRKSRLVANEEISGIIEGEKLIRSVPWQRIEVITELPEDTDWDVPAEIDGTGLCQLLNKYKTMVSRSQDPQQM